MAVKNNKKRAAPPVSGPSKKRKVAPTKEADGGGKKKVKAKGKEKAADRETIPIPIPVGDDDIELSEDVMDMLKEYGGAVSFLSRLDEKEIAKSKKEIDRLHRMHKPARAHVTDDLPSLDSDGEEDGREEWSSGLESSDGEEEAESVDEDEEVVSDEDDGSVPGSDTAPKRKEKRRDSDDEEMPYEAAPRKRRPSWDPESDNDEGIERLPIKLPGGRVLKSREKVHLPQEEKEESSDESDVLLPPEQEPKVEDVSTGARFGRLAVVDVISQKSRKARIQAAKEQIAGICQEIVADPENSASVLGLLRRLHTFSLPQISTPSHPEPVSNDPLIRRLTFLSQLAVFKDIIPGYRIRALTDKEKAEKVSQMVQRTRDWEQGLVGVYQQHLRSLEAEVKAKNELSDVALQCMCTLLVEVTHFNFRTNLMSTIVGALSRKSWDKTSDLCLNTLIAVFRADNTGVSSLEIVRLLNRMIKERKFSVHPEVLTCLAHLRLKTELGVRASETRADKPDELKMGKTKAAARRAKGKETGQPHLSKKAKKEKKEKKEIEKEMNEAAAEVDKEERAAHQTETLKLLFVLYFRILKNPHPTPLLPAALRGIAKFAHLVNIDFFKDLMQVLKDLMARETRSSEDVGAEILPHVRLVQHQLLCIVTAFELLSGQGEALEIDLSDFITRLYAMLPSLAFMADIEAPPRTSFQASGAVASSPGAQSASDTLFRALHLAFSRRTSAGASPPWRSAALAKRLLGSSLQWPPDTATRAIAFVGDLVDGDPKLGALLSTDERSVDGVYRPDLDDPQLCHPFATNFWELHLLAERHWSLRVREAAAKLLNSSSS
ncbi:uncharacterized protein PHACADRAFT_161374 [Phanerochaete carnosa HHB-10118-sp]|uniref:Nucleolar complex-associated protein 3 n=1 Tax=Phanerochaete carnosa (strain HHB-10118-sp) TaxID=650164 RepID=K5VV50_PHACS|nr:uncharacterized protein PHACADRAFT_161374 [Phanerochaete carnosa HHB-10118-sp]EKM55388.1 hypothetical protein PHACADRAFT_161374 [Phanerochaete carnosa HHB-10118-sp]